MENLVKPQQLFLFAFQQPADGNAGPAGDDFGHFAGGHFLLQKAPAFLGGGFGFEFFELPFELGDFAILELRHAAEVAVALGLFHFVAGQFEGFAKFLDVFEGAFFGFPLGF